MNHFDEKKQALTENPEKAVELIRYAAADRRFVLRKAHEINIGMDPEWNSCTYWAGVMDTKDGVAVVVGLLTHLPDKWRTFAQEDQ